MVFIEIVKTALKRKCDWDIIGVTWSRSSGLSFRLCVIDQLWWWRHLLWLFFIHCWFEILNICALFDPHRGAHVIIVINSITRSCIQSALVDTWTKDDRIQESWSHIIIFLKDFYFLDKIQIRKLFDQDQHFLPDPEKSGHLWRGEDFYLGFCSTAVIVSVVVNLRRLMKCRTWKRNCSSDCRPSSEADNHPALPPQGNADLQVFSISKPQILILLKINSRPLCSTETRLGKK